MKKTTLCLALAAAAVSFQAAAVSVSATGRGQALIFPYYSVESGQTTTLSLTNHTDQAKALVVSFRESLNGRPVLTFNLYLGKRDVWTAGIFSLTQDGPANLTTADRSCTVPGINSSFVIALPNLPDGRRYVPFRNFAYVGSGSGSFPGADGGPTLLSRTRTGFIEVIETATLVPDSPSDLSANTQGAGACASLEAAWGPAGYWTQNALTDLAPPSGGLSGTVQLVDVSDGALATAGATALAQFNTATVHPRPGEAEASTSQAGTLGSARTDDNSAQSLAFNAAGAIKASNWPVGQGYKAVSAVLAKASAGQEYLISAGIGAASDWVLNFPTRRYHTDPRLSAAAVAPFTTRFGGSSVTPAATCESVQARIYDRDRATVPAQELLLCGSTQVLSFGTTSGESSVLGAPAPLRVNTGPLTEGTMELDFSGFTSTPAIGGETWTGLPVIGAWFYRYSNANARPGQLGLYSGSAALSGTGSCTGEGC